MGRREEEGRRCRQEKGRRCQEGGCCCQKEEETGGRREEEGRCCCQEGEEEEQGQEEEGKEMSAFKQTKLVQQTHNTEGGGSFFDDSIFKILIQFNGFVYRII